MENCPFKETNVKHVLGIEHFYSNDAKKEEDTNTLENVSYNLGKGKVEQNRAEAGKSFLEREFPSMLSGQSGAIFLPNCFIAQRPDLKASDLDTDYQTNEQQLEIEKNKTSISGDNAECWIYEMLRELSW